MLPYNFKLGAIYIDSIPCLNIISYSHYLKKPNYNCPGELIIFLIYYFSNVKINKISFNTKKGTLIMISIKELRKNKKAYKDSFMKRGEKFDLENIIQIDSQIRAMKKESLHEAKVGAIALFETRYSNRLNGNVNKTYLNDSEYWVELARHSTPSENFLISTYEKVNGFENYEKSHFKFIEATNESDPTAFYCLGNTYLTKLNNLEKAYNAFAKSIHIDSTYSEGFLGLGKTMIQTKNFKNAIVFINKGLETSPGVEANEGGRSRSLKGNEAILIRSVNCL